MKPSHDAQDHARGHQGYHSRADIKRGLDGRRGRERNAPFMRCLGPRSVKNTHYRAAALLSAPPQQADPTRRVEYGALCQNRTHAVQKNQWLDHFVGASEQRQADYCSSIVLVGEPSLVLLARLVSPKPTIVPPLAIARPVALKLIVDLVIQMTAAPPDAVTPIPVLLDTATFRSTAEAWPPDELFTDAPTALY